MLKIKTQQFVIVILAMAITSCPVLGVTYQCSKCVGYSGWQSNSGYGEPPDCDPKISTRTLGSCEDDSPNTGTCTENSKATKQETSYTLSYNTACEIACGVALAACGVTCDLLPYPLDTACQTNICDPAYEACMELCQECVILDGPTYSDYQNGCI